MRIAADGEAQENDEGKSWQKDGMMQLHKYEKFWREDAKKIWSDWRRVGACLDSVIGAKEGKDE